MSCSHSRAEFEESAVDKVVSCWRGLEKGCILAALVSDPSNRPGLSQFSFIEDRFIPVLYAILSLVV